MLKRTVLIIGILLTGIAHADGHLYSIESIGLTDTATKDNVAQQQNGEYATGYSLPDGTISFHSWVYDGNASVRVGLYNSQHTRSSTGTQDSQVWTQLSATGAVAGISDREGTTGSQSAWVYDGTVTRKIGLYDREHKRDDGKKFSQPISSNSSGHAVGWSDRYENNPDFCRPSSCGELGRSAWLYDGASTIKLGYTNPRHTREDGKRASVAFYISEAARVLGESSSYYGNGFGEFGQGTTVWVHESGKTTRIGFFDAEHTGAKGYRNSQQGDHNSLGQLIGYSDKFADDDSALGRTVWLFDGTSTTPLGLTDAEHTNRLTGETYGTPGDINEAGQVTGAARRYGVAGNDKGQTAWLYDGSSTIKIGFYDAEHTSDGRFENAHKPGYGRNGYRESNASFLNESGQVAGSSVRFATSGRSPGSTAWLYDGQATRNIGLVDEDHTDGLTGERYSYPVILNDAGQVAGLAENFAIGGRSAWYYDGTSTKNISPRSLLSRLTELSENGMVAGYYPGPNVRVPVNPNEFPFSDIVMCAQYGNCPDGIVCEIVESGGVTCYRWVEGGQTAWIYDGTQTVEIDSFGESTGRFTWSEVSHISESGIVLGSARAYDAEQNSLGMVAFAYTIELGVVLLNSLVDDSFEEQGWESLSTVMEENHPEYIYGEGTLLNGDSVAFKLTPVPGERLASETSASSSSGSSSATLLWLAIVLLPFIRKREHHNRH